MALDQPTTLNQTATFVNGLISAAVSGGEDVLKAYLTAQIPFLADPIFQFFLNDLVSWIGNFFSVDLQNIATVIVTDIQTNGENSEVYQAGQEIIKAVSSKDQNAITQATQSLVTAWGNAVHFDGTSVAH